MIKGFTMDNEQLKGNGGNYWKELLDRIRDIRSSQIALCGTWTYGCRSNIRACRCGQAFYGLDVI